MPSEFAQNHVLYTMLIAEKLLSSARFFFFFFLYTGPFVLKIILLRAQYRNFMLFYVAI